MEKEKTVRLAQIIGVGLTTNIIVWYDFLIFGYLAQFIGKVFFNTNKPELAIIYTFAVFCISYLVRPICSFFGCGLEISIHLPKLFAILQL